MAGREIIEFFPPVDREGICFYCDNEAPDNLELNMMYRPRDKDVSKGISLPGSVKSFIYVPCCDGCFSKLDGKVEIDKITLVGWDWWDAVDGMPNLE